MLYSANDGAIAIAEYISGSVNEFCLLMNKKAAELGAYNTNFTSPHGLDNDKHYSTPYDLAVILDYALNNELFRKVFNTKSYVIHINGYERSINNTNKLITTNNACFGGKTGYTGKGGYCLASNYIECDNDYIVVTLGNGTSKQRFSDNENLFKYGIDNYTILNTNDFLNERQNIFLVKCNETIEFERNGNEYFSVHNSDLDKISVKYIVSENIELPISINQVLGKGEIYLGENMVASLEYVALKDYVKTSFLDYFKYIIYNYTKLIKLI